MNRYELALAYLRIRLMNDDDENIKVHWPAIEEALNNAAKDKQK